MGRVGGGAGAPIFLEVWVGPVANPPMGGGQASRCPAAVEEIFKKAIKTSAMAAKPIVTSKQREEVVRGVPTEVVCTAFSNSILVVVTQYGKMGTLVSVDPSTITSDISKPSLTTKVLLGTDEPLIHVCAKNLVTFVSQEAGNKPVLLAIALKDKSMEGIKALQELIRSCQVW
ncbi:proteasome assembly chaperone 3 isoform X1 [Mauremys reevesii]|uniref:proteasome assembly chaperone 3 isoform X1 n=1 Tax=Mauremys reevesii TaxID=260615 RepID=UPI00193F713B|nr:proteasome assembly chaperone 3 isoform X1 [Mauremys reevesii]